MPSATPLPASRPRRAYSLPPRLRPSSYPPLLPGVPTTRRADVRVAAGPESPLTFLDIVVTASAHLDRGAWHVGGPGTRVRAEEKRKRDEWAVAGGPGAAAAPRLVPFAWEGQGRLGPAGCGALAAWAKLRVAPLRASLGPIRASAAKAALLRRWRAQVSCALQRANVDMIDDGRRPRPLAPGPHGSDSPAAAEALWHALC